MANDNAFIKYDESTGLVVRTPGEILLDLTEICKQSYGPSFSVEQGTEMYAFLDALSYALAETGGAMKALYDAFSFTTATGAPLDMLCSLAGISRNLGETDTQLRARYFINLFSNSVSTIEGLKAKLIDYNIEHKQENETTLINVVQEVRMLNNDTSNDQNINGVFVEGHSIAACVRLDPRFMSGGEFYRVQHNTMLRKVYLDLDNIVLNYKSLGCGTTPSIAEIPIKEEGTAPNIIITDTDAQSVNYVIALPRKVDLTITIELQNYKQYSSEEQNAIINTLTNNLTEYINNTVLGEDILYSGIMSCVFNMYKQLGYTDDIINITSIYNDMAEITGSQSLVINANEYAVVENISINITNKEE